MEGMIYCLVDPKGTLYGDEGADSFAAVAARNGLAESDCQTFRFDLATRQLLVDRATPAGERAVRSYFDEHVGTPERLMAFAEGGHLSKGVLVNLLATADRAAYLAACAALERQFTVACAGTGDTCLASGCSIDTEAGETCLQPLLNADAEYHKACGAEWSRLFRAPEHRIDTWRN